MFHKASLKLAAFYLAIIMVISLFFSISLYNVSIQEFNRQYDRQTSLLQRFQNFPADFQQRFYNERQREYDEACDRLLRQLLLINLLILLGGGILSYYLASRTLRPIEEAHEAQSQFTADASHELRTPIAAMQSEIEVALMNPKMTLSDAKKLLHSNLEELGKLTTLSEGLLRLARMESHELELVAVEVDDIIIKALRQVSKAAEKKHIAIKVSGTKGLVVLGDEPSLTEVIVILLDNAIKYSPDKSPITITTAKDQTKVTITVSDKGIGIHKNEQKRVFERFYRADAARTKATTGGYGLGLAIAKNIVTMHQGEISVKSEANKGARFSVRIPFVH